MRPAPREPVVVPVLYDFASTLCYVAHRVVGRLDTELAALGIALDWQPVDLARLAGGWRRGAAIPAARRRNVERAAQELGVAVRVPETWPDSRPLLAAARLAEAAGIGAAFRSRVWETCAAGDGAADGPTARAHAAACGLVLTPADLAASARRVEADTRAAACAGVAGVPTFRLGDWPMTGIQDDATMRAVLARYAERVSARGAPRVPR